MSESIKKNLDMVGKVMHSASERQSNTRARRGDPQKNSHVNAQVLYLRSSHQNRDFGVHGFLGRDPAVSHLRKDRKNPRWEALPCFFCG